MTDQNASPGGSSSLSKCMTYRCLRREACVGIGNAERVDGVLDLLAPRPIIVRLRAQVVVPVDTIVSVFICQPFTTVASVGSLVCMSWRAAGGASERAR